MALKKEYRIEFLIVQTDSEETVSYGSTFLSPDSDESAELEFYKLLRHWKTHAQHMEELEDFEEMEKITD